MLAVDQDVEYDCIGERITPATTRYDYFDWIGNDGVSIIKTPLFWHATTGIPAYPDLPKIERSTISVHEIETLNILQATEGIV